MGKKGFYEENKVYEPDKNKNAYYSASRLVFILGFLSAFALILFYRDIILIIADIILTIIFGFIFIGIGDCLSKLKDIDEKLERAEKSMNIYYGGKMEKSKTDKREENLGEDTESKKR